MVLKLLILNYSKVPDPELFKNLELFKSSRLLRVLDY